MTKMEAFGLSDQLLRPFWRRRFPRLRSAQHLALQAALVGMPIPHESLISPQTGREIALIEIRRFPRIKITSRV